VLVGLMTLSIWPTVAGAVRTQSGTLEAVDWANSTIPGAWCGSGQPITLANWAATIRSRFNANQVTQVEASKPQFGDIGGSVGEVAVLPVGCNNGGGTADGQIAFALVVFAGTASSAPRVFGVLSPRQPRSEFADHTPLIAGAKIDPSRIVVREAWYGQNDTTCCSTGRATTTWRLEGERLVPSTVVNQQPSPFTPNPVPLVSSGTFEGTFVGVDTKTRVAEFFMTCMLTGGQSQNVYEWMKVDLQGAVFLGGSASGRLRHLSFESWSLSANADKWTGALLLNKRPIVLTTTESVCHGTIG
jgi:hypothetical protein